MYFSSGEAGCLCWLAGANTIDIFQAVDRSVVWVGLPVFGSVNAGERSITLRNETTCKSQTEKHNIAHSHASAQSIERMAGSMANGDIIRSHIRRQSSDRHGTVIAVIRPALHCHQALQHSYCFGTRLASPQPPHISSRRQLTATSNLSPPLHPLSAQPDICDPSPSSPARLTQEKPLCASHHSPIHAWRSRLVHLNRFVTLCDAR